MSRRLTFVLLFLIYNTPWALAHAPVLLDARHATPGLRIDLLRLEQADDSTEAKYHVQAFGFPRGVKLLLWAKEFDHSSHQLASVFEVDDLGNVLEANASGAKRPRKLEEITFEPGPYPRGATWELALVSVDRKLQAFAKTIPYPIIAHDGRCTVSLELGSHRGEKFLASGFGFSPGDEVITELVYAGRVIVKRVKSNTEGSLPAQVFLHASVGNDRHSRYSVKGRSCMVTIDYEWGEPAIATRY